MAPSVWSGGTTADGNDQVLLSGIEPKPRALAPIRVVTLQLTLSKVISVTTRPPNFIGAR